MQYAVIHPGLRHRQETSAVVAAVAGGHQHVLLLRLLLAVQVQPPPLAQGAEEEIDGQRGDIAAPSRQQAAVAEGVDVPGHPGVEAGAGDGQGQPAVAVDGVQGEGGAVPQLLNVQKPRRQLRPEVFEEVVAGACGHAGHGRVGEAGNGVGHLVHRAVAAAGVETHRPAGRGNGAAGLQGVAGALGEDAGAVQAVPLAEALSRRQQVGGAFFPAGIGVDNQNVPHRNTSSPSLVPPSSCRTIPAGICAVRT